MSRALDQRSFVSPNEAVSSRFLESLLDDAVAEPLRRLRHYHALAGHRGRDYCPFCSTLHLFDCIHRGQPSDRGTIFLNSLDDPLDDFFIDERPHSVVHKDDIVGCGIDRGKCIGNRLLAVLASLDELNLFLLDVLAFFFKTRAETADFVLTQRDADFGDLRAGELAHGVDEYWRPIKLGELF